MRRRLDRVNRTASLVSYEERAESAVPRAKAQRVRRRMHYAMSLQCFQVCACARARGGGGAGAVWGVRVRVCFGWAVSVLFCSTIHSSTLL